MLFPDKLILQNASYVFFKKETKQNKMAMKERKKYHPAAVEPETFVV